MSLFVVMLFKNSTYDSLKPAVPKNILTVGITEGHASGDMIFVGKSADEIAELMIQ